jgi:cell division protein FtsQ
VRAPQAGERLVSTSTTSYVRADAPESDDEPPRRWGGLPGRTRVAIIVAALVVVALFGTWLVAFSSVFGVRSVDVHGEHTLTAAAIEQQAAITTGTPLVRLDTATITSRLEQLADVESAEVSTSFPSTVTITIVERVPVGYVHVNGTNRLVDRTGDQYRSVTPAPANLPLLIVPSGTDSQATGGAVATVASALSAALLKQVKSIQAVDPNSISLLLTHSRIVNWGSAARSHEKAQILPILLKQHDSQFDVSNPDLPFSR